ncbi:aspartic proteinase Asp1-like [Salvia splendens]|uniref:aspartic proteinase Asp1-like n=1 Tax=Salvia splendens TaxID=180675 RepID=UPI001C26EFDC|nr:aspartic proteinase Asp1-like [Salvia splendens]
MSMDRELYLKALVLYLLTWIAAADQPHTTTFKSARTFRSSVVFPVAGNVYPKGYYHVTMNVGQPPRPYFLDIDTGSDLTWLQCDAPCTKCTPTPHSLYKPKQNLITCVDPVCVSLHGPGNHHCQSPEEQCDYEIDYADHGSSLGVMVKDLFPLRLTNGTIFAPKLAFGCGYNQEVQDMAHLPYTDGVLGLGLGNSSILAQLRNMGLIRNVVGHCLSRQGGGFLFFGDDFLPNSGINWTPLLSQSKFYSVGPADLQIAGQATNIKGLPIVFDSGSTYTYFSSQAYNTLISLIKRNLNGKQLKDAVEDKSLPVCWKGAKPFKSILDAANHFKPLALSFTNAKNVQLHLPPESYLVVTEQGNVCLGILDGGEVGLENLNVIGDIFLQDKLVIYDNERQRVGWVPANCNNLPNMDSGAGDLDLHYEATIDGKLRNICPARFRF